VPSELSGVHAEGRDWAVRDYRTHLQAVLKRTPATVNNALAAVDDLYIRRGLGSADAKRLEIPAAAPRALDQRAQIRYLRAVQASSSPRDRALALVPFYAGARISGTVALDVDDLRLSARRAILRIYGKGERVREVPIHPKLREALENWLEDRKRWPGSDNRALFVMRFYREFLPAAPRAVNGFFAAMTVPPADLFPEHLHLRKVCAVVWCVIGSEQEATRLLAPVHDIGTPLLHHVGPMPHPVLQSLFDGSSRRACSTTGGRTSSTSSQTS
jgi:hypothetical protein